MCGIAGILSFDGQPVAPVLLDDMTAALAHRGPDERGIRVLNGGMMQVGLGHTRLKIIDLSPVASQPMSNEDKTQWIVFNGEVYNFQALRSELQGRGHAFRSRSDTEVILHLYDEMGEKCVDLLEGMFAFAIWDQRRRRLFLARDRAGKKPLFYAWAGAAFIFGSEVKAVLQHPAVSGQPSLEALPHYFTFGYPPPNQTFYQGICQLAPAHTMTVEADGRIELRRYWDLEFSRKSARPLSLAEASTMVRTLVTEAVQKRLVADVPLGAFLSGGVDSSIVVGVMSRLLNKPVKTFSLGFSGDPGFDETRYARLVAAHFGTDHTEFIVEPNAIDMIESLVWQHDGPFADSSAIPTHIVSRLTRQHVTVALNGDGGDELFAGYLRLQACVAAERLPSALCRLASRACATFQEPNQYHHWLRRMQRFFAGAGNPLFTRLQRWISVFDEDLPRLLRPEVFEGIAIMGLGYPPEVLAKTASWSPLSKVLYVNFMTYLPDDLLVKVDRCTMAHGLEGRSPFLDHRLAEYVASLPDQCKLRRGVKKYILKRAFANLLPREILQRGKMGFGVPLGTWFRGELRDYVRDLLLSSDTLAREYLVMPYIAHLIQEHIEGTRDHAQRLWTLMTFEIWLRLVRSRAWNKHPVG